MRIISKTDKKESLGLLIHINSFLFEQQYGELKNVKPIIVKRLKLAAKGLCEIIDK